MDQEIQTEVDRLLLEQGDYSPIELLLAQGRLFQEDLEAWRGGDAGPLEEALFGDPDGIRDQLQAAAEYAGGIGLEAEERHYRAWGGGAKLRCATTTALDTLLRTHYLRPAERPQLDLFMDGGSAALISGVTQALADRDPDEAQRALQRLRDDDPGHAQLGALERLVEGARGEPHDDPAAELKRIEGELQPLAEELLGSDARAYLTPLWQRLHEALAGAPFDPDQPRLHPSHSAERLGRWEEVLTHIEHIAQWRDHGELLRRHARAAERTQHPHTALADWFQLCWRHPDESDAIDDEASSEWRGLWRDFLDLDTELPEARFPAWLLLQRPGLAGRLSDGDLEGAPESFQLLKSVIVAHLNGDATLVERRKALKESDPELFRLYMARMG